MAIGAAYMATTKLSRENEKAKKAAQEAKEEYQKLNSEFQELESTLNDLDKAQKSLDELKKDTDEWRDAVRDLNEQVMDVITKYPELAQYVENINGSLRLSEKGMQEYLNKQYTEKQKAYADTISTSRTARETNFAENAQNISNKTFQITDSDGHGFSRASTEDIQKAAQAYLDDNTLFSGNIDENLKKAGFASAQLREAIIENKDAIRELALEYQNTGTALDATTEAFLQSNVENDFGDQIKEKLGQDQELYTLTENNLAERVGEIAQYLLEADNDINT